MSSDQKDFEYSRRDRLITFVLFSVALFLPVMPAIIGLLAVVIFPPFVDFHEALLRLHNFFPALIHRNPLPVLLLLSGLWALAVAATLPNAITYSLATSVNEESIGTSLFGIRVKHMLWDDVTLVNATTTLAYSQRVYGRWQTIKVIEVKTQKERLVIRETILNFRQLLELILQYADRHKIPKPLASFFDTIPAAT